MNATIKRESSQRLSRLQQAIRELQADACLISTSVNQFYLLGFIFDGYIFVQPDGDPVLFVKRPSGITGDHVSYIRKPEQLPDFLRQRKLALPGRVMVERDALPYSAVARLQTALGMPELMDASGEMRRIRSVKSEYELEQMRECANIHAAVYQQIPHIYRDGMTDIEFQIELEREMRLAGSSGIFRTFGENMDIFMGSILTGDNAQSASPFDFALGGQGLSPLLPIGANGTKLIRYDSDVRDRYGARYCPQSSSGFHRYLQGHCRNRSIRSILCRYLSPGGRDGKEKRPCRLLHGNKTTGQIRGTRSRTGN